MGLDIGGQDFQSNQFQAPGTGQVGGNQPATQSQKPEQSQGLNQQSSGILDQISQSTGSQQSPGSTSPSNPNLSHPPAQMPSFNKQVGKTIENLNLPKGDDLNNTLSEETQAKIRQFVGRSEQEGLTRMEMKKFFDLLSKLYPFSLSILEGIFGGESDGLPQDFADKITKMLNELAKQLNKNIDSPTIPKEMKGQLKELAGQLAGLTQETSDPQQMKGEIDKLLQNLQKMNGKMPANSQNLSSGLKEAFQKTAGSGQGISFESDPELFQELQKAGLLSQSAATSKSISGEELKSLMTLLQANTQASSNSQPAQNTLNHASDMLHLLGMLQSMPKSGQKLAFSSLLASHNIQSSNSATGLIGPSVDQLANGIGKFISDVQKGGKIPSTLLQGKEAENYYSNAFKQVFLTGAVLGNILAKGGREVADDAAKFALLKMDAVKELRIVDQIPFSFLAFFPDLTDEEEDFSDAVKTAKQSLLKLIRILLKLIFVLAAIASAGNKLGKKEMDKMLAESSSFITGILDDLTFALKKVDENYVINVNFHTALAQAAKDNLTLKKYDEFWESVIHMFSPKTELAAFLEDMEDAKPLFKTIESLMSDSDTELPVNIQF